MMREFLQDRLVNTLQGLKKLYPLAVRQRSILLCFDELIYCSPHPPYILRSECAIGQFELVVRICRHQPGKLVGVNCGEVLFDSNNNPIENGLHNKVQLVFEP